MNKYIFISLFFFAFAFVVQGQKLNIGFVYPAGGQQGTTFEVEVGGQNLKNVTGIHVSGGGVTGTIVKTQKSQGKGGKDKKKLSENEQIAERIRIKVTIDKDAVPSVRDFRLTTTTGMSNRIFFEVSQLPNFLEEPTKNQTIESATKVPSTPVILNGQVLPGERDHFVFEGKKGEQLVCFVKARALVPYLADAVPGWFQSVLTLYDSKGKEIAYNDDYKFNPDPLIVCTLPENGKYYLEIKDAIYRGREDFVYRIAVGEIPFIYDIFPLGGRRDKVTKVTLNGVNLASKEITVKPGKNDPDRIVLQQKGKTGFLSNEVFFEVGDYPEYMEKPSSKKNPMPISLNSIINGTISTPYEEDWFVLDVKKGERIVVEVNARKLGSPIDAELSVYDSKWNLVVSNDDLKNDSEGLETHHADPGVIFAANNTKDEGLYYIRLIDSQNHGGKDYTYRLKISPAKPDFDLRIDPSSLIIPRKGTAIFTVHAIRKNKFNGDIEVNIENLPKGYLLSKNTISKGESRLRMTITAPEDAEEKNLDIKIKGTAEDPEGGMIERIALPAEEMTQAFYILHLVPTQDFNVNVSPPLPFSLKVLLPNNNPVNLPSDTTLRLKVKIEREPGFDEKIQLITARPWFVRSKMVEVLPDVSEVEVELEFFSKNNAKSKKELIPVILSGVVKGQRIKGKAGQGAAFKASVMAYAPSFEVRLPKKYLMEDKKKDTKKDQSGKKKK